MPRSKNSKTTPVGQSDLSANSINHCAQKGTFQAVLFSILAAMPLFFANAPTARSGDGTEYLSEFLTRNPARDHENFRGKIINILYSCTTGRSSSRLDICQEIERNFGNMQRIKFIKTEKENQYAVNFISTSKQYPSDVAINYNLECRKFKSNQTEFILNDKIDSKEIDRCADLAILIHLGFDVNNLAERIETDIDVDKIISPYLK